MEVISGVVVFLYISSGEGRANNQREKNELEKLSEHPSLSKSGEARVNLVCCQMTGVD